MADSTPLASLGIVLHCVPLVLQLGTFRDQALATLLAAALDQVATGFGFHAGTEPVLIFAGAL